MFNNIVAKMTCSIVIMLTMSVRDRIFCRDAYQRYAREVMEFIDGIRPNIVSLAPKPKRGVQDALFA